MQALNVSRGGTLIQDIESQVPKAIKHRQGVPIARNSHGLDISPESVLFDIVGEVDPIGSLRVNSHHHQAVRSVGRDLKEIAWANDGVIEGIQDTRVDRFVVGVQWHPELSWKEDRLSRGLFESFVESCRTSRKSPELVTLGSADHVLK
jgi:putative glutamine amidotransferase